MRFKQGTADGASSLHFAVRRLAFRRAARELFNPGLGSLLGKDHSFQGEDLLTLRPDALALLDIVKSGVQLPLPLNLLGGSFETTFPARSYCRARGLCRSGGLSVRIRRRTFVSPSNAATISQNQTLSVDTTGIAGAAGVDFYHRQARASRHVARRLHDWAADPTSAQGVNYSSNGSVDSYQLAVGGWSLPSDPTDFTTPYPITIDAIIVDSSSAQIGATVSRK